MASDREAEIAEIAAERAAILERIKVVEAQLAEAEKLRDQILESIRAARAELGDEFRTVDLTPGCDCDQVGTPDAAVHASDCTWIARRIEVQNGG